MHQTKLSSSMQIFPQLNLPWTPDDQKDDRSVIADFNLLALGENGHVHIGTGVENKGPIPIMLRDPLPTIAEVRSDSEFHVQMRLAYVQAMDQVKVAIRNHMIDPDSTVSWVVAIGPYITIIEYPPFTANERGARGHRPNDSADVSAAEALELLRLNDEYRYDGELYHLGTKSCAIALHNLFVACFE